MSRYSRSQGKQLFKMTLPMLIGMLAISSSQLIDSAFIGQLGKDPLAVVGFSIPIYQLIIGIQVGLGIATTSLISTALGAKKSDKASQLGTLVILTGTLMITSLCLILWWQREAINISLGAEANLLPLITEYWQPWLLSCWLGAMLYFGFSILRAHGDTKLPGLVLLVASLINIVLDPIFIFYLDMGLAGAAWATVCAFAVGSAFIFYQLIKKQLFQIPTSVKQALDELKALIKFMLPTTLSQFLPPVAAMLSTVLVAHYGSEAVAAWGMGSRIEFFSMIIVLSLTMSMPPMIGRYMGSHEFKEADQLVRIAIRFVLKSQLAIALLLIIFSAPLAKLLANDAQVTASLLFYLWFVPLSYGALGISMITVSACSAMGLPKSALLVSILRLFICYLPCLWLGAQLGGLEGLFCGALVGNIFAGITSWMLYQQQFKKRILHLSARQKTSKLDSQHALS